MTSLQVPPISLLGKPFSPLGRADALGRSASLVSLGWVLAILVVAVVVPVCGQALAAPEEPEEPEVLARVEVNAPVTDFPLAASALLRAADGRDYLLVFAARPELTRAGWPFQVLDAAAVAPAEYLLAREKRTGARPAAGGRFAVLHDDGAQWLVKANPAEAEALAELGFAVQRLGTEPLVWSSPVLTNLPADDPLIPGSSRSFSPFLQAMVGQVQATNLYWMLRRFCGNETTVAGGAPCLVTTRFSYSGQPVRNALQIAFERLRALGLNPQYQAWTTGISNLIATLPGTTRSNEFVWITAHLDDMPSSGLAPGADDNASGSAAVLTAASLFSQCRFERTVRFALFTGEEQGLYGSAKSAQVAKAAGENIVAVFNADMLAWHSKSLPTIELHTRTKTNPGYSNDLAIAMTFTNMVATYGLSADLAPVILNDAVTYSDHASFWSQGFPAVLIEEEDGDFNPYYHTANDKMAYVNWGYLTAAVRASVATVAELALPVEAVAADAVEVVTSNWLTNGSVGAGSFFARRVATGWEPLSVAWSNAPVPAQPAWLKVASNPLGRELQTDARPVTGESWFDLRLSAVTTNAAAFACSNSLRFDFVAPPLADQIYLTRVRLVPEFTAGGQSFLCVTNLRELITQGGTLRTPMLTNLAGGAGFGTCDLVMRALDTNAANVRVELRGNPGATLTVATMAQVGARIVDEVQASATLAPGAAWQSVGTFTNLVAPDQESFDRGWKELRYPVNSAVLPGTATHFLRLRRSWLEP